MLILVDTLLDLHSKLSTVVRYYDRMLEERLSSAYSQHNLGYGAAPGAPQYPNMPGLPAQAPDVKSGAENFYYGNPSDIARPPTAVYAAPPVTSGGNEASSGGLASPVYPPQASRAPPPNDSYNNAWNSSPYPSLGPQQFVNQAPHDHVASGPGGPAQYTPQPDQDPTKSQFSGAPYHQSPVMRRDSQYQSNAPPSAPEPHSPGHVQSPTYPAMSPTGPAPYQQPSGPPSQSYYYQQQQQQPPAAPSAYSQMTTGQPGAYPEASQSQLPASHQPARPVEESLIEL